MVELVELVGDVIFVFLLIDGGYVLYVIICNVMLYLIIDMYMNKYILCICLLMF